MNHGRHKTWQEYLWEKVDKNGPVVVPALGKCWIWTGLLYQQGYGQFTTRQITEHKAHRAVWLAVHGELSSTICVLHKCDNPSCVNPNHLFLGTHKDNSDDMIHKGRGCRGINKKAAKLSEDEVREIRRIYAEQKPKCRDLGKQFGVSHTTVISILHQRLWRHVQ